MDKNKTLISEQSLVEWIDSTYKLFRKLISYYKCAMMEIETKFNVLNEELSLKYDHNPIETIKSRIKSPESIIQKMKRRNIEPNIESLENKIFDIAGVRIICSYISDIYMLQDALLKQDDVKLIEIKDYIKNPKPNGYRSLHLIVEIPIFLHDRKKMMKVEVQIRTLSMDFWASLEHKIKYKKELNEDIIDEIDNELLDCANICNQLDKRIEGIKSKAEK